MDLQNIQEQLNTEFAKVDVRIIFWFDDKGDYAEEVSEIQLDTAMFPYHKDISGTAYTVAPISAISAASRSAFSRSYFRLM